MLVIRQVNKKRRGKTSELGQTIQELIPLRFTPEFCPEVFSVSKEGELKKSKIICRRYYIFRIRRSFENLLLKSLLSLSKIKFT